MEERADEPVARKELEPNENKMETTPVSGELAQSAAGEDSALAEGGAAALRVSASNGAPQEQAAAPAVPEAEPTHEPQKAAEAQTASQPAAAEAELDSQPAAAAPQADRQQQQQQQQQPQVEQGGAAGAPAADAAAEEESQPAPAAGAEATGTHSSSGSAGVQPDTTAEPAQPLRRSSAGGAAAAPATHKEAHPAPAAKALEASKPAEKPAAKASFAAHKETAAERLTTPTAMRMLKTLKQTQGGKAEFHTATGVPFKSKKLAPDEMSAMVDRLCTPKHAEDNMPPKPHAVKLVFEGTKEVLVPVKDTTQADNIAYMATLYERCQETRAKTMQSLQDKWLQPLIKPRAAAK